MHRKHILCAGLYVRDDKNGKAVLVGDRVRVTRPELDLEIGSGPYAEPDYTTVEEKDVTGDVVLLLSKGIMVRDDQGRYYNPDLGYSHKNSPWTWEKLNK